MGFILLKTKDQSVLKGHKFSMSHSHAGLFNLCVVVLVAVNSRLIIENLMKSFAPTVSTGCILGRKVGSKKAYI
ncbi:Diacylglycerol O-acyltransferase 1C [Bienertia sinuspersici]